MTEPETAALTRAMAASGQSLDLKGLDGAKVDKHSTGGVGDGVSLALAPLVAAAGLVVPMMSGRGLGHTGGTLDKLESIAGFRVRLELPEIRRQLAELGVCLFGQSDSLAPADRKLYALRDATATVESLPLIVSSILSKKLAEDLDALVLDVKVGAGAIFQEPRRAEVLGRALVKTARGLGRKAVAVMTAMEQPLGRYVGNSLEIRQALEVLQGDCTAGDYIEVLLALGGWMVHLGGKARSPEAGARILEALIRSGEAADRFKRLVKAQGGDARFVDDPSLLPQASLSRMAPAPRDGFLSRLDARVVGETAVRLGAGRQAVSDPIDFGAGLMLDKKLGDRVKKGESVARLFASDAGRLEAGLRHFQTALEIAPRAPKPRSVVLKVLK
jgi:pyrimidine-nucleoside phosphorylase